MHFLGYIISFLPCTVVVAATAIDSFNILEQNSAEVTFFPGEAVYSDLNEDYFTSESWRNLAFICAPTTAQDVSFEVKVFSNNQILFATRGGGYMPNADAANIDSSGVLLSNSGLNQLQLSDDESVLVVGAGNKWAAVYQYLESFQLTVVGGRAGTRISQNFLVMI